MTDSDVIKVVRFLIETDSVSDKFFYIGEPFLQPETPPENYWEGNISIAENCNDLFYWACADSEDITVEDIPLYKQCIEDCEKIKSSYSAYAGTLYACRKRKMRPQNPCYASYPKELWPLLDSSGPERPEKEAGSRKRAEEKYEARQNQKTCSSCLGTGRIPK